MPKNTRIVVAFATLVSLAVAGLALAAKKDFSDVVDVVVVEVPVHVIDDGGPVRGLTVDNFELYDGRKKQQISGFEVIDLGTAGAMEPTPAAQVPLPARRHFMLLFDFTFSEPDSVVRARYAAKDLVLNDLHPSDLVAVASYTLTKGPQLILGFTSDRRQIELAIDTLGLPELLEQRTDPLGFMLGSLPGGDSEGGGGGGGSRADQLRQQAIVETLQDLSIAHERSNRDEAKNRVLAFTTAFTELAKMLQSVPGTKQLVLLSEGVDSTSLLGTTDVSELQRMNSASESGQYWEIDSDQRFGSTSTLNVMDQMIEEFRRADCVIQAVDIGGLRAGPDHTTRSKSEDSLFMMADGTGGELYRNFNDPGEAMGSMLDRTSVTYMLSFQPDKLDFNGDYHKLKVKLKGGPRGARLVHRPGYFEPRPYAERSALERRLDAASQILSGTDGGVIASSVLATPILLPAESAYVPVLIEIDGESLLGGRGSQGTLPLEIYAYAIDQRGAVGDFFSQRMGLDLSKVAGPLAGTGLKFFGHLDLWPGEYTVRVLVRDMESGRSSRRAVPVSVPQLGGGQQALSVPLFPEPVGKWLLVREDQEQQQERNVAYPFIKDGQPYVPAARPVLAPGASLDLYFLAFNAGDGPVNLGSRVLSAAGEPVSGPQLSLVGRTAAGLPGVEQLTATFATGALAAGEYVLEVKMGGEVQTIPFVVSGG